MSNPTERRDDQPTPHARRGRPRRDRKEKNLRLHKLLPKPRQWQDAAVAFTPSRYHPGGRARHPVGRASQSLQQVRVRDPGASPPSPTAGSAAQHAGGASIASNPLDFDVASTYRQAGGAALINGSIGRTTTPHGPGVPEEFLGLTRPGPDAVYNLRERIPVRLEDLYTSHSLNCWAACTCSPKTIIKEQFISNLWGIPLQKLLFGMRIEIGTKDFSEMKYDQLVWEEAFLTGQIEGWDPGSIDVPGWDIELGMLHSMYIQGGYRLYIRLTEGSVDGGFAEPPPTRGGGVASIRDRLGPWNSGPPWSTPNVNHDGSSSYGIPLPQPAEYPTPQAVSCQGYPSEDYSPGSQEPEDVGTGIPEPLLTPGECSLSPASLDPPLASRWDSPDQQELYQLAPGPWTQVDCNLYAGNYYTRHDAADTTFVSDSWDLQ